jgi:hypothetical protein
MSYGYVGDTSTSIKQQVKNAGVLSVSDVLDLESKGQLGGSLELIEEQTYSTGVNNIDFLNIKETKYDVHLMQIQNLTTAIESGTHFIRFFESGVLESASVYQYGVQYGDIAGNFGELKSTGNTGIQITSTGSGINNQVAYIYLYNLGNSSKYSFCTFHLFNVRSGNDEFQFGGGVLPQASVVDGIRYAYTGASTISDFTIKLYGVKQI